MAYRINIPTVIDERGTLAVIDKLLPFEVKRVFYMYNVSKERGGHRHKKTFLALICLYGCCTIYTCDGKKEETFLLDSPNTCLILNPEDWHTMSIFSPNAILLVLASTHYDKNDYLCERP